MQSTSDFRKHLRSYHQDLYSESDPKQSKIRNVFTKSDKSSRDSQIKRRSLWTDFTLADKQHADSKLTDWIANHSQSFSVVEHEDFREFSAALRCDYQVPCRNTIKNRIIARWTERKKIVRQKLRQDLAGRRCGLTTDMWTSSAKRGYMLITAHYVDAHWDMKNVIIAFIRVIYPHTGKRLADHLVEAAKSMDPMMLESV